jgi:CheY-like chemotaxis protein
VTRALIVDDNRALAEDIAELLSDEGYEVLVYSDPTLAARDSARMDFDIALLDVRMPGLDGVALQRELSALHAGARYVLMTAYTEDERLAAAHAQGIRHVLTKPVLVHDLLQVFDMLAHQCAERRAGGDTSGAGG